MPQSDLSITVVDDPYERGAVREAVRSTRDDPLAGMHARRQIDDCQFAAGRLWQRHRENSQIGTIRAIDPERIRVDGGRAPEPITDRQLKAFRALAGARAALGNADNRLVEDVLGHRAAIIEAAEDRGFVTKHGREGVGRRFRAALNTLARLWGLSNRP